MSYKSGTGSLITSFFILIRILPAFSSVYYIASDGSDMDPGTLARPLASIQKAQELVRPGDTVYMRGGTYLITEADVPRVYQDLFACISFIDKSGTAGNMIRYWAFPGEIPVFDLSAVTPANQRVVGIYVTADYVHFRGFSMTGVQGTITGHTESYCIYSWGDHNIFEQLSLHDNQGTGLRHRRGGHNLFLDCDAFRNHDYTSEDGRGSNTDVPGYGHVMRNNLAYKSSYNIRNVNYADCDIDYNSFDLGLALSDGDFLSLDETLLTGPRNTDGSLPENDFMRLAPGGAPLDKGVDIGYAYYGTAPDLGAWEQDYIGFPDSNVTWFQYFYPDYYWEPGRRPRYLIRGLMNRDTSIQDTPYRKLFSFSSDLLDPAEAACAGAIRETADKKVYFRNFGEMNYPVPGTGDILLYDFGARIGDTIRGGYFSGTQYLVVSGFDRVLINGEYRKRILFKNYVNTKWIMGMGNERGLLFPSGDQPTNGSWGDLVCFYRDGEEIFHLESYENCYEPPLGSMAPAFIPGIKIFPNPCSAEFLHIETVEPLLEVMLHDARGKAVRIIAVPGENFLSIPAGKMECGMYFLRAAMQNGKICFSKFIINR